MRNFIRILTVVLAFGLAVAAQQTATRPLAAQRGGMSDQANDPFVGIWELNRAKTTNYAGRNQTIVNVPEPGGFKSRRVTLNDNKTARVEIHPYIFDGSFHLTEGGDPREISYKRLDPNTIERTTRRNGQLSVDKEEVSKDGKTLTVTQPGSTRVFDKQFSVQEIAR